MLLVELISGVVVITLELEVVVTLSVEVVGVMSLKLISPRWTQVSCELSGKENSTK